MRMPLTSLLIEELLVNPVLLIPQWDGVTFSIRDNTQNATS